MRLARVQQGTRRPPGHREAKAPETPDESPGPLLPVKGDVRFGSIAKVLARSAAIQLFYSESTGYDSYGQGSVVVAETRGRVRYSIGEIVATGLGIRDHSFI